MLIRYAKGFLFLSLALLFLSLLAILVESGPGEAFLLQPASTPAPSATIFLSQVSYTPVQQPDRLPQDVAGVVIDRAGAGLKGVPMKALAPGFEAITTTTDGGVFHFSLNSGNFTIQPTNLPSQPASIAVDGKRRIRVEFRERVAEPFTPTVVAAPTAVPEPTVTITPTPIPIPTPTATPTPTPLPTIGPPVIIPLFPSATGTIAPPKPSPTPSAKSAAPQQVNLTPWVYAFFAGTCFAVVVFGIWLLVSILRRRR